MTAANVARRWGGRDENDRLAEGEEILSMYNRGARVSELSTAFGYSPTTIRNRIDLAIKARIAPTVDKFRMIQGEAIDTQLARIEQQYDRAEKLLVFAVEAKDGNLIDKALSQRLKAIDSRNHTLALRARLFGLDAPAKIEQTVTVTTPVDAAVEELSQRMRERSDTRT